ncbi:hypothetical protein BCR33DRAFT_720675 [Rhizoclosmatium globosum]|uniref:Uncharacterized protein n=1 Tax=Rhizoclosmatium globosum TaxID=329046 RepID=A0A1Y2BV91_9FUNG|nr:hypothetical protein BCR33DRAFT_720675 [Rhizoclosmatium globosum]|eukprot:ORY38679.1 hypothetical protein BCR33DRAFT_720675 [Rhizoclosmatium globosum]
MDHISRICPNKTKRGSNPSNPTSTSNTSNNANPNALMTVTATTERASEKLVNAGPKHVGWEPYVGLH